MVGDAISFSDALATLSRLLVFACQCGKLSHDVCVLPVNVAACPCESPHFSGGRFADSIVQLVHISTCRFMGENGVDRRPDASFFDSDHSTGTDSQSSPADTESESDSDPESDSDFVRPPKRRLSCDTSPWKRNPQCKLKRRT